MRSRMGRRRLPPAPAMNSPISWISATGESISSAIASSTALSSGPTARATRSLSRASSGVGAFTIRARGGGSTHDDAVFHLDLRSRVEILDLDDRELVADLGDLPRRHLLVQLAQQLARDGVDDGDLVAAHTHGAAGLDSVLPGSAVSVRRDKIAIVHPITGELLGELDEEVAAGRITEVREKFSVVELQSGPEGAQVKVKDRVVLR